MRALLPPCFYTFCRAPALQPSVPCRASRPAPGSLCRASRPATRRPLLKKGSIRKLFLWTGNILFMEGRRIRNTGAVDFWVPVYGYRSPSPLWVFCALVHGGRHLPKALGFSEDASRLHDLKRPSLFRRDKVPARNIHRLSGFAFTNLKKFLRVPRGAFSKTLLGREWDGVPQRRTQLFLSKEERRGLDSGEIFIYNGSRENV